MNTDNSTLDKRISFIFPSRERFQKFFSALDNIRDLSESDNYEVICALDADDEIMNNAFVKLKLQAYKNVSAFYGDSKTKIEACNKECMRATGDIIILTSDDMKYTLKGFDNIIREEANNYSGIIHFPDMLQNERLCTLPVMTKEYMDIDGWIYHPSFKSVFADNLQQELAKKREKYKFVMKHIIEHCHYRTGKHGEPDALMIHNDSKEMYIHDHEIYNQLRIEYGL